MSKKIALVQLWLGKFPDYFHAHLQSCKNQNPNINFFIFTDQNININAPNIKTCYINQKILIVADDGVENEAITRLARVGYDNVVGYLKGGFDAWKNSGKEVDALSQVTAEELKGIEGATVVDVRKSGEYLSEHLIDAIHVELDYINDQMASVPQEGTFYVHCAGGYRSVIASSILKARGYHNMVDVAGGFKAIKEAGLKVSDYVCPTTL